MSFLNYEMPTFQLRAEAIVISTAIQKKYGTGGGGPYRYASLRHKQTLDLHFNASFNCRSPEQQARALRSRPRARIAWMCIGIYVGRKNGLQFQIDFVSNELRELLQARLNF